MNMQILSKHLKPLDRQRIFLKCPRLLKQVEAYKGSGISAGLFYEGKVAEAISLIVEWSRLQQQRKKKSEKNYPFRMFSS